MYIIVYTLYYVRSQQHAMDCSTPFSEHSDTEHDGRTTQRN